MKSVKANLGRSLDRPDPAIRFYLFYGQDDSQSRAFAERLLKGLEAEKFVVPANAAKADSALLADEASAIGLFGGKRAIWIEPAGDEIAPAVEALLQVPASESPVIALAGALKKSSALMKLAEASAQSLAHISYALDQRDAAQLVEQLARAEGLRLAEGIAARIAAAAGNDRGIIVQELAKMALYAGATPGAPVTVDREILDEIGAGSDGDWMRLGDFALSGDVAALSRELDCGGAEAEPVSVLRALQRRLAMLAPIRARVDRGERPHDAVTSAGKSVFWKEKDLVTRMVTLWDSRALARVVERSGELERRLMRPDSPPPAQALEEELVAIARTARRR
ncbi:MAG: DNA polymerase III subunit delta [Pseudomonadota bacterium]|nr:DNA polymerase III subunit delta [Pseudomonadota bacterium]